MMDKGILNFKTLGHHNLFLDVLKYATCTCSFKFPTQALGLQKTQTDSEWLIFICTVCAGTGCWVECTTPAPVASNPLCRRCRRRLRLPAQLSQMLRIGEKESQHWSTNGTNRKLPSNLNNGLNYMMIICKLWKCSNSTDY